MRCGSLCLAPPLSRIGWGPETLGDRAVRAWSAGLLWIFGFRLRRFGTPLPTAGTDRGTLAREARDAVIALLERAP